MSTGMSAALRAIVAGLRKSGAISDEPHIAAIVRELEAAEKSVAPYGSLEQRSIRELCMGIAQDSGIKTKITTVDPPLNF